MKRGKTVESHILIVEDEPSIVTLIQYNLTQAGFLTEVAFNGEEALEKMATKTYDLIVLDIMLPKKDGVEVCRQLRQEQNLTPVIMLTAKDTEYDKIHGLEIGADDYLTKPFSPKELIARIKAVLRRTGRDGQTAKRLHVGDIEIYPERFEAFLKSEPLSLKRKEFEVLLFLMRHQNQILSRSTLLQAIWEFDFVGDTRIVDVQISNLRDKIEADSKKPQYIKTVRGFGYKLEEPI